MQEAYYNRGYVHTVSQHIEPKDETFNIHYLYAARQDQLDTAEQYNPEDETASPEGTISQWDLHPKLEALLAIIVVTRSTY